MYTNTRHGASSKPGLVQSASRRVKVCSNGASGSLGGRCSGRSLSGRPVEGPRLNAQKQSYAESQQVSIDQPCGTSMRASRDLSNAAIRDAVIRTNLANPCITFQGLGE